jgi:hypothetical protein
MRAGARATSTTEFVKGALCKGCVPADIHFGSLLGRGIKTADPGAPSGVFKPNDTYDSKTANLP